MDSAAGQRLGTYSADFKQDNFGAATLERPPTPGTSFERLPVPPTDDSSSNTLQRDSWANSDTESTASHDGARLEARLLSRAADHATLLRTPKTKRLKTVSGSKYRHADGDNLARTGNSLGKYTQPWFKGVANHRELVGANGTPMQSLASQPNHALVADQYATGAAAMAADLSSVVVMAPLSAFTVYNSLRFFRTQRAAKHAAENHITAVDARLRRLPPAVRHAHPESEPLAYAERETLEQTRDTFDRARIVSRRRVWEFVAQGVGAAALSVKTFLALGVKIAAGIIGKGSALASSSAALTVTGIVGSFVLAPIAALGVTIESSLALRKAVTALRDFRKVAPEAKAYVDRVNDAQGETLGEEFAAYRAFFLHKFSLRERFHNRVRKWGIFRTAAAAFYSATTLTKLGIGIAALCIGGFAVSNPVGWALLGLVAASTLAMTIGAFIFVYARRAARYDKYQHHDDPEIDREFMRALSAFEAAESPADAPKTALPAQAPAPAAHSAPSAAQSHPARAGTSSHSMPFDGEAEAYDTEITPSRSAPTEHTPLMHNMDIGSGLQIGGDSGSDDDDDQDLGPPPVAAHVGAARGTKVRSHIFGMVQSQIHNHNRLHETLRARYGKARTGSVRAFFGNLLARVRATGTFGKTLATRLSWHQARNAYRDRWTLAAARLTNAHFKTEIASHTPAWREFMQHHAQAAHAAIGAKRAVRNALPQATSPDHVLFKNRDADDKRYTALTRFLTRLEATPPHLNSARENREFLELIHTHGNISELSDDDVNSALARAVKKQLERRFKDLKGELFEAELDAARVRLGAQSHSE